MFSFIWSRSFVGYLFVNGVRPNVRSKVFAHTSQRQLSLHRTRSLQGKLGGKTVIITGAGRGIGRVSALAFAAAGASVACVARRQNDLDDVVAEIKTTRGTPALAVSADVSDPNAAKTILTRVEEALGPVDILINNAGVTRYNSFEAEESLDGWWRVLEINLRGAVSLIHGVLGSMIARGSGTIISVASTSGSQDVPFNTAYATSKAALIKFHQDLNVEVRDKGIHNYAVHPGSVQTDLSTFEGAVNVATMRRTPKMQEIMSNFKDIVFQTPQLSADTFVALCADEGLRLLSGKFVDAQHDLGQVLDEVKKGSGNRIERENLYHLKLDEL
ncbi:MAG: hypothetical protein M1833_002092 [Piccolia ochrophora]|nr:MAG: hypothetical protein M1833_002092 [Piccolia ochrophora]